MSVGFSTWIRIGGRIRKDKIEPLLKAIREAGASLEWAARRLNRRTPTT